MRDVGAALFLLIESVIYITTCHKAMLDGENLFAPLTKQALNRQASL